MPYPLKSILRQNKQHKSLKESPDFPDDVSTLI